MALQTCRECGREVSTEAEACPHCGVRSPTREAARREVRSSELRWTAVFVALVALVAGLWWAMDHRYVETQAGVVDRWTGAECEPVTSELCRLPSGELLSPGDDGYWR